MRWIFLSLLFCNVLFFGWQQWIKYTHEPVEEGWVKASDKGGAPRVTLLSESKRPLVALSNRGGREMAPNHAPPPKLALATPQVCQVVGPFLDMPKARSFASELKSEGINSELMEKEVVIESKFWVYLSPMSTKTDALRRLKQLQSKKVDSFLISRGELKNGISLGIFSSLDSANGLLARLDAAGIGAQLKKIGKSQLQFWVRVEADSLSAEAKKRFDEKLQQRSEIKVAQSAC